MAYLCGRPLPASDRCVLGRETAIQPMRWCDDGWLRTIDGSGTPVIEVGQAADRKTSLQDERHDFDESTLPDAFQWLRTPYPTELFSLSERPDYLRLFGRETIGSEFTQSLVARRQQAFRFTAETELDYNPANFQQAAGLVCYYNSTKFHLLQLTVDDDGARRVQVMMNHPHEGGSTVLEVAEILPEGPVGLRVEVDDEIARFAYRPYGASDWTWLPETFDHSLLSDEATLPGLPNFTGAFVGMACYDLSGARLPADFAYFNYVERE